MSVTPSHPPVSLRKLPPRPDLEQLKHQAKELLGDCLAGEAAAVALMGRFFRVSPGEPPSLAQAQLALARSYGFESWSRLKAHVDGVTFARLRDAVKQGEVPAVREMLQRRPELVNHCADDDGERRLVHWAVLNDDAAMVAELMRAGADVRLGIWPHRECTSAYVMAQERGQERLLAVMDEEETRRRERMSCPNVTISRAQDQLNAAIREHRNEDAIAMLVGAPELMRQCDRDGGTPLHVACEAANEVMVEWLCERRADARKLDARELTPMDRAAMSVTWRQQQRRGAALRIMERLLARGCAMTPRGAAALGNVEALGRLYQERPASLAEGFDWLSGGVLTTAVRFGQVEAVRCLLDLGLNPDEPIRLTDSEEEAWSWGGPLWHAAAFGEHEIARLLLDRGADPSANVYASGWPLDRAYERGDRAMVELLYARGAKAAVYTVCRGHDVEAAARLLESGDAEVIREMVWSAGCSASLPIMRLALPRLQLAPDDPRWHDLLRQPIFEGDPPVHLRPAGYEHAWRFELLRMMLEAGANPNVRANFGLTLLHFVAARALDARDRRRFAELLLDAGADPSLRDVLLESTALGWACRYGRRELVELLLERGVSAEEPLTPEWARPLAWAKKMGHAEIARLLQG